MRIRWLPSTKAVVLLNIFNKHFWTVKLISRFFFWNALLIPIGGLAARFLAGTGANPIEKILRHMGTTTLVFLFLTLAVTPLRRLTGWAWPGALRRMAGLFAFFFGTLHFIVYIGIDQFFSWASIVKDVAKHKFVTVGFATWILLIPLAVTSTNKMIRRMGGKQWRALHRLTYLVAAGGVFHYLWLVKKDIQNPLIYGAILAGLLGLRVFWFLHRYYDGQSSMTAPFVSRPSIHRKKQDFVEIEQGRKTGLP